MQASRDSGAEQLEILPLVIVTQGFAARPSSLPDIRDFVRRRVATTTLSEDDVRILCGRVAELLLEAAGTTRTIQVSLRIFPDYAEVDVVIAQHGGGVPEPDEATDAIEVVAGDSPEERLVSVVARPVTAHRVRSTASAGPGTGGGAPAEPDTFQLSAQPSAPPSAQPSAASFPYWLAGAIRREGMTLETAARRLGVSTKTVSRWIGGATEPRLRDLSRIREVFGDLPFL